MKPPHILVVVIGKAGLAFTFPGCERLGTGTSEHIYSQPSVGFKEFTSTNPNVNFTFHYPEWWELIRIEDLEEFTAITFMGDLGNHDDLAVYIGVINNEKRKGNGREVITPEKELEAPLAYWKRQRNFRLLRDTTFGFDGVEALDAELTADVTVLPPPTECAFGGCYRITRDRFIAAGHLGTTYTIHIRAWADQYKEHTEDIEQFLESFRFVAN